MYIDNSGRSYYRGTEQHSSRAPFLILVQPEEFDFKNNPPIRALVRKVAMHQCGHWMMGSARAFGHKILLSGAYGGDGLPTSVPQEVYDKATPVPSEKLEGYSGWNEAGLGALVLREWAVATFLKGKDCR